MSPLLPSFHGRGLWKVGGEVEKRKVSQKSSILVGESLVARRKRRAREGQEDVVCTLGGQPWAGSALETNSGRFLVSEKVVVKGKSKEKKKGGTKGQLHHLTPFLRRSTPRRLEVCERSPYVLMIKGSPLSRRKRSSLLQLTRIESEIESRRRR